MDLLLLTVVAVVALALLFDFSNGFHDAANSIATVVATRALSPVQAVWLAAVCNFAAYFFVGTAVANTVSKTVKADYISVAVIFAALMSAIVWNYVTWFVGMPSSSSHAIIGGLVGAGLAVGGTSAVGWSSVKKVVYAIALSPLVAFTVAAVGAALVWGLQKLTRWNDDAKPFKGLQIISAAAVSFGHGANDAQKTMGVIAAVLAGGGYLAADAKGKFPVPTWVALSAYAAIAVGTVWGGWRIIETMGMKLTNLNARVGVAANIGATTAIFGATSLGIPISTTHAAASSVVGAGAASGRGANWKVVGEMVIAWIVTIPATTALAFVFFKMTQLPGVFDVIVTSVVTLAIGVAIAWAMTHSISHKDLEAELQPEETVIIPDEAKATTA
ncbi:MAG: inorganic phosphate transporter [Kineosporiaceae bacterium]|nr:inorganic phosphate transporter [Kineosporiaceae bacterium]